MNIEFSSNEIDTLLTSLSYSKQRIADSSITPSEIRQEELSAIGAIVIKLRKARSSK